MQRIFTGVSSLVVHYMGLTIVFSRSISLYVLRIMPTYIGQVYSFYRSIHLSIGREYSFFHHVKLVLKLFRINMACNYSLTRKAYQHQLFDSYAPKKCPLDAIIAHNIPRKKSYIESNYSHTEA